MNRIHSFILSISTAIFLTACGGGGGDSSSNSGTSVTGTLIDNAVSGIKYINGDKTGYTDSEGKFPYTSGLVEFYLGDIKIGEINSMTPDGKVFIQDIVGVDRTNVSDAEVLKIASLLQGLDSDPSTDEIEIPRSSFDKFVGVGKTLDELDVNTFLTDNSFAPRSEKEVIEHLTNSLKQFKEIDDTKAPTLVSSSITNGSTGVSNNPSIVLTFSEDIPKKYISSQYFTLSDTEIGITSTSNVVTITTNSNLAYSQSYELTVSSDIKDFSGNSLSNEGGNTGIIIEFSVQAEPDTTPPVITSSSIIRVDENQTNAFTITATDESDITYSISGSDSSAFDINTSTGVVTFKVAPDYETKALYTVMAIASDTSANSHHQTVDISINDVNEIIPDTTAPILSSTNKTFRTIVGTSLSYESVTATDNKDDVAVSSYEVVDFNTAGIYEIEYSATDSSSNKSSIIHTYEVYDIVNSSITGKTWLDRNIGAKEVCNDISNIYNCVGDYFQWGRSSDGHEKTSSPISTSYSGPLATTLYNLDNTFIRSDSDWVIGDVDNDGSLRSDFWSKTDGSAVCPSGFRIPKNEELRFELRTADIRVNTSSMYSM